MTTIETFCAKFARGPTSTRKYLEGVPGRGIDWRPHPKSFTLGELARGDR